MEIISPAIGDTINDGTVTWTINKICSSSGSGAGGSSGGGIIHTETITESGTWTAPITGGYKFILLSGGGGGGGSASYSNKSQLGGSGASGATKIVYINLNEGDTVNLVVGAGGNGGNTAWGGSASPGGKGGTTSITIGETIYSIDGGYPGQGAWANTGGSGAGSAGPGVQRNDLSETDSIGGAVASSSRARHIAMILGVPGGISLSGRKAENGTNGFIIIQYLASE